MDSSEISSSPRKRSPFEVWSKRLPAIVFLGLLSFLYLRRQLVKTPERVDVSTLRFVDMDGTPLPDSLVRGKAVVLNYWAPWCPPCRLEIPWLQSLQSAHPNDLLIIGVVADSDQYEQAKAFMQSRGISYPVVRRTDSINSVFGNVTGLPTTFYISSKGKVLHSVTGLIPELLMQHYVSDTIRN